MKLQFIKEINLYFLKVKEVFLKDPATSSENNKSDLMSILNSIASIKISPEFHHIHVYFSNFRIVPDIFLLKPLIPNRSILLSSCCKIIICTLHGIIDSHYCLQGIKKKNQIKYNQIHKNIIQGMEYNQLEAIQI